MDEKTKARIKEHIDLHLNAAEAALKGFETAKTIVITDDAGFNVTIEKSEESIKRLRLTVAIYTQLKKDYDAGNFDTDTMVIVREIVSKELPKKRAIRQNKNTNQLVLSILTPTEIIDKRKQIREPIRLYAGARKILYDGCYNLTRERQTDAVRFMDLWSEHWGKEKTPELRLHIKNQMKEWGLSEKSYGSFRTRLKQIAAVLTSIKEETAGGYRVLFTDVDIEQNTGYFFIRANESLCKDLEASSSVLMIAPEYWLIDAHYHPYAPAILRKLTLQAQIYKKSNRRNVMLWRTLIKALPHLPQESQFKDTDRHTNRRIFTPLMKEMDYLKETKLVDWHHIGTPPENIDDLLKGKFEWEIP